MRKPLPWCLPQGALQTPSAGDDLAQKKPRRNTWLAGAVVWERMPMKGGTCLNTLGLSIKQNYPRGENFPEKFSGEPGFSYG